MSAIEAASADDPVESLQATDVQKILDKAYRDTPAAGRVFRSTLGRIISWGIPRGYRKDNPVEHTERIDSDGTYSPCPPEAFDIFFQHVRVDLHLNVYSALFTGQRKVDVLKMIRPRSDATDMPIVAQKTDIRVPVQIHSEYRRIIDATPVDKDNPNVALHLMADAQPWTSAGHNTACG